MLRILNFVILPTLLLANIYFVFNGPFDGSAAFSAYAAGFVTMGLLVAIGRELT